MTHLRQGKKVSLLPPGDVNPGSVSLKKGLLKDCPYHVIEIAVRHAMSHDHVPRASRDLEMLCGHFHKI
jgi:hypothetical protein